MERNLLIAHISALICVTIWGLTFIFSKDLMSFLSPLQLMCTRFLLAFIVLWIIHPVWNFNWHNEAIFLVMGILGNTLYFYTENLSLTLTYTSNTSILASTTTLMSLVLMWALGKEVVHKEQTAGFIMAFIGVIMVILNGAFILHLEPLGDLLALMSALSWALYGLVLKKHSGEFDSFLISRKVMFYGFMTTLPLALIEGKYYDFNSMFTLTSIGEILFLAVLGSCICYIIWNNSIKKLGVVTANSYIYIMPLVTMIAGALVFNEQITWMSILGTALIILGLFVSNRKRTAE